MMHFPQSECDYDADDEWSEDEKERKWKWYFFNGHDARYDADDEMEVEIQKSFICGKPIQGKLLYYLRFLKLEIAIAN